EREQLVKKILSLYRTDPDAGIHSAAEWILRRWKQGDRLQSIDRQIVSTSALGKNRWYVSRQGHTLAVIVGPVEVPMGSPFWEEGREEPAHPGTIAGNERRHRRQISRTFAIATKEVAVAQFNRFQTTSFNR